MNKDAINDYFHPSMTTEEIRPISNLGLAHLGDAVFEVMVRAWLLKGGAVKDFHRGTVRYVSAKAQAKAAHRLIPNLTEDELSVFRRGRNSRVQAIPKNASVEEYHTATGLEALFGYLYLLGNTDRLNQLFTYILEDKPHAT